MGESKSVLVVDDERHLTRLLESHLTRQGYRVSRAYGGGEAIALMGRERFDLAVIDREMPEMSGPELLEWIRANEETKDLKVIMLGKDRHDDDSSGPMTGATLWLTKPFSPARLLEM